VNFHLKAKLLLKIKSLFIEISGLFLKHPLFQKMMLMKSADHDPNNYSEFKKSEKQFRHFLKKQTDFTGMIDLNKYDSSMEDICTKSTLVDSATNKSFEVFKFNFPEGLYVIKNFLTIPEQLALSKKCINDYYKKPNRTNLYIYDPEFNQNKDEPLQTYDKKLFVVDDPKKYYFNTKIRWSNIGFQYDWNDRLYPAGQTAIPDDLAAFPLRVLKLLDFGEYKPECVILNYYGQRNYMGGHLDDGEKDQVSPIISFSIGLSCIFLIGGKTRDIKPHPIKLDSGNVEREK